MKDKFCYQLLTALRNYFWNLHIEWHFNDRQKLRIVLEMNNNYLNVI
jgi:hypothetical protein